MFLLVYKKFQHTSTRDYTFTLVSAWLSSTKTTNTVEYRYKQYIFKIQQFESLILMGLDILSSI